MLEVRGLSAGYGAQPVLSGVSLDVGSCALVVLVGANGAGKSTLLGAIAGLVNCAGTVRLDGADLTGESISARVARGMVLVPEGRRLFGEMTVRENLELGGYLRGARERRAAITEVLRLFPRLAERMGQAAGTMSGGEQQMLAVARALVSRPRLLMLDEPSLGLAPTIVVQVFSQIQTLREGGTTILLNEQLANKALSVADHGVVLHLGRVLTSGSAAELLRDEMVRAAYIGG
jgi:branched-chain amino acid transport system ATP-binding protein